MNSCIRSNVFLDYSFAFSMYKIIPSANRDSFTSFFLIWMSFISFSCLIALTSTSSITLNRCGESRYSCIILNLGESSFPSLRMMLVVDF